MAITIDKKKCIGCGTCAALCEDVFEMDEDEFKAKVKKGKENSKDACVKEAINSCPTDAIKGT